MEVPPPLFHLPLPGTGTAILVFVWGPWVITRPLPPRLKKLIVFPQLFLEDHYNSLTLEISVSNAHSQLSLCPCQFVSVSEQACVCQPSHHHLLWCAMEEGGHYTETKKVNIIAL